MFSLNSRNSSTTSSCDGIGGPTRHDGDDAGPREVQFGEEGLLLQLGDDDCVERGTEVAQQVDDEVVGHRSWRDDAVEREHDRLCLGRPDEDGKDSLVANLLAQQDARRVGRRLDAHTDEFHVDHELHPTRRMCARARSETCAVAHPTAVRDRSVELVQHGVQQHRVQAVGEPRQVGQGVLQRSPRVNRPLPGQG